MYKPLERAFEEKASDLWLRIALPGEEVKRNLVVHKAWKSEPVKAVVREAFSALIRLIHGDSSRGRRGLGARCSRIAPFVF